MTVAFRFLALVLVTALSYGCDESSEPQEQPTDGPGTDRVVAPKGFDTKLLEILACPENLTSVRLAKRSELDQINARINSKRLTRWAGEVIDQPVQAALIREDSRIGYEIKDGIPIMLIEEALLLDEAVGAPDPEKHRKR